MKKCIAIILAGMMILSAACSKSKETTTVTSTTTTTESTTEESSSETVDPADLLSGKFNVDPKDPDAGVFSVVKAIKVENIELGDFFKGGNDGITAIADQNVAGKKAKVHAEFTAKKDSKLTLYIFPASSNFRWTISEALGSQTVNVKAADTGADFEIEIPKDTKTGKYDFVFVEEGAVIGYYKDDILKNEGESKLL